MAVVSKTSGAFDNCALHLGVAEIVKTINECKSDQDFSSLPAGYRAFKNKFFEYYDIPQDKRSLANLKLFLNKFKLDARSQEMIVGLVLRDMFKEVPELTHLAELKDSGKYQPLNIAEAQVIYAGFGIEFVVEHTAKVAEGADIEEITLSEKAEPAVPVTKAEKTAEIKVYIHGGLQGGHWDRALLQDLTSEDDELKKQERSFPALTLCNTYLMENSLHKTKTQQVINYAKTLVTDIFLGNKEPAQIPVKLEFLSRSYDETYFRDASPNIPPSVIEHKSDTTSSAQLSASTTSSTAVSSNLSPSDSSSQATAYTTLSNSSADVSTTDATISSSTSSTLSSATSLPETKSSTGSILSCPPHGLGRPANPIIEEKVEALLNTAEEQYLNTIKKDDFKSTKSESLKELYTETLSLFSENKQESKILDSRMDELNQTFVALNSLKNDLNGDTKDPRFKDIDASINKQTGYKVEELKDPLTVSILRKDVIEDKITRILQEKDSLQFSVAEQKKEVNNYLKPKK